MRLVILILLLLPLRISAQEHLLVSEDGNQIFLKGEDYFNYYDSTLTLAYFVERNQPGIFHLFYWYMDTKDQYPEETSFADFTKGINLDTLPMIDTSLLSRHVEFQDSLPGLEYPCSQADEPAEVMFYNYTSRIYYKEQLVYEQAYQASDLRNKWSIEEAYQEMERKFLVFIDQERGLLYCFLGGFRVVKLE